MSTPRICPTCGKPVPTDAPHDVCPACLLQGGFATGSMDSGAPGSRPRFTAPTLDELTPLFPQLELLEFIGQGGMGAVYKARQKELDRLVALKILPPGIGDDPAFAERFTREARALAKLNHPGIVTLYEFGKTSSRRSGEAEPSAPRGPGIPARHVSDNPESETVAAAPANQPPQPGRYDSLYYFLMEFVDGVNLRQLLRTDRVSSREALAIVPQICDALQFAHDQGIVHRDIKPENILLDRRGRVKVADFGLAKLVGKEAPLTPSLSPSDGERVAESPGEGSAALTVEGKIMGTPHYMSPEQSSRPAEVDHRADIYALGVVFYQMLTGELPEKQLQPPSKKVLIDVRLDEIVLRALEKNPDRRYQQVSQVKTGVETILKTPQVVSADLGEPPRARVCRDAQIMTPICARPVFKSDDSIPVIVLVSTLMGAFLLFHYTESFFFSLAFEGMAVLIAFFLAGQSRRLEVGNANIVAFVAVAAVTSLAAIAFTLGQRDPAPPPIANDVPRLRFLAWQDEYLTDTNRVFHPDGSSVTSPRERSWLQQSTIFGNETNRAPNEPRFLRLWFSCPAGATYADRNVEFLDESGHRLPEGRGSALSYRADVLEDAGEKVGWFTLTLSPFDGIKAPANATVRLRYTPDPETMIQEIFPRTGVNLLMPLTDGSQVTGMGEDAEGRTFVTITTPPDPAWPRKISVTAIGKDGREVDSRSGAGVGGQNSAIRTESFDFRIPLSEVAKFRVGFRPIRAVEWKDVALPQ
jgi:serine/threonine protein kinase